MMEIDPVCKRDVDTEDVSTLIFEGCAGRNLYFCSEKCKADFVNDPGLYHKMCHD